MNYIGGYILLDSKEMLELFNHIGNQDSNFKVDGLYKYLSNAHKTGKNAVINIENAKAHSVCNLNITYSKEQNIYVINSISSGLAFSVTIASNDNCAAHYVSI